MEAQYQQSVDNLLVERDQLREAAKSSQSQCEKLVDTVEGLKRDLENSYNSNEHISLGDEPSREDAAALYRFELDSVDRMVDAKIQAALLGAADSDHSSIVDRPLARGSRELKSAGRQDLSPDGNKNILTTEGPRLFALQSS